MAKFFSWLKIGETVGIIASILTIFSVVFGIGIFFNKVDNLENNVIMRLNAHGEIVKRK